MKISLLEEELIANIDTALQVGAAVVPYTPLPEGAHSIHKALYPSQISGRCMRRDYYIYNFPITLLDNLEIYMKWSLGTLVHGAIQFYLTEAGFLYDVERKKSMEINGEVILEGRTDGYLCHKEQDFLLEIKTTDGETAKELAGKYSTQIGIYLKLFDLDKCLLLAYNKRDSKRGYHIIRRNYERERELFSYIEELAQYIADGELPEANRDDCYFCSYQLLCNSERKDQ